MSEDGDLDRSLGLIETIAISMGSMIGSGIFILPGVAYMQIGNQSVVLAFLLGGILTIPAALSAAELSTAIPESGGSYTYIQRGMGPLMGTIAGVGNWMVLNFKTALALIGGIPYLVYIYPAIQDVSIPLLTPIVVISILLTIFFTVINAVSSASAGKIQNVIVVLMLMAIGMVVAASIPDIASSDARPIFDIEGGFIAVTSLVFVAYAGVIKVTSVAEEIKNPGRNIPYGIIISLIITTVVYVLITYIAITTVDIEFLAQNVPIAEGGLDSNGEGAIIAIAAENVIGFWGAVVIVIAALMALASTANSGILSASRYPFAMARDKLANKKFGEISDKTGTPIYSVLATGAAVVFMVTFLPVDSVAKFGAAFQIIVFILVSISVIGFRESAPEEYNPDYLCPFYPYTQIFGLLSGLMLLSRIGAMALTGSVLIVVISIIYYYVFIKDNLDTESAVKEGLRKDLSDAVMNQTKKSLNREGQYRVMIALWGPDEVENKSKIINICQSLSSHDLDLQVDVVEFEKSIKTSFDEKHPEINRDTPEWIEDYSQIEYKKIETRNVNKSIVEYATYNGIDLVAHHFKKSNSRFRAVDNDLKWTLENAPCDSIVISGPEGSNIEKVSVVSSGSTYLPTKILMADAVANYHDAYLEINHFVSDGSDSNVEYLEEYLDEIMDSLTSTSSYNIIQSDDIIKDANSRISDADIILTELDIQSLSKRVFGSKKIKIGLNSNKPVVFVYSDNNLRYQTISRRLLMRYLFRGMN